MFVLKRHAEDLGEVTRCQPYQFDAIQGEDGLQVCQRAFTFHRGDDERLGLNKLTKPLARFWRHQDKRQDAYDLLAPVYNWFTEGLDTADL